MVERDVVLAKGAAIDRCLNRVYDVRSRGNPAFAPVDVEDITVLNIQRAAQAAIDLAAHSTPGSSARSSRIVWRICGRSPRR